MLVVMCWNYTLVALGEPFSGITRNEPHARTLFQRGA